MWDAYKLIHNLAVAANQNQIHAQLVRVRFNALDGSEVYGKMVCLKDQGQQYLHNTYFTFIKRLVRSRERKVVGNNNGQFSLLFSHFGEE